MVQYKTKMTIKIFKPENCSDAQLKTFYEIVVDGNQVNANGLLNRIKTADFLSFCELDDKVVGVASIKNPDINYKKTIFEKANVEELADDYKYERNASSKRN